MEVEYVRCETEEDAKGLYVFLTATETLRLEKLGWIDKRTQVVTVKKVMFGNQNCMIICHHREIQIPSIEVKDETTKYHNIVQSMK